MGSCTSVSLPKFSSLPEMTIFIFLKFIYILLKTNKQKLIDPDNSMEAARGKGVVVKGKGDQIQRALIERN